MKVSSTTAKITPRGVFYLDGYLNDLRQQPGQGVHDDPYAVLLLIEDGETRILFIGLDVCLASLSIMAGMRAQISALLGIPDELIVVSTTHTHSCPNGLREDSLIAHDTPGYADFVSGIVVQAASLLPARLVEVRSEILSTHIRGWYSNRNGADKPFDDEGFLIRFVTADGAVAGAMQNFNCHSTVVGAHNMLVTADLQGSVRAELSPWVGCVPYAFTGASGDLGNRQFRKGNGFDELRRVSVGIAAEFMKGSFQPIALQEPCVREFRHEVDYDNTAYFPTYERQLSEARAILADGGASADAKKLAITEVSKISAKLQQERIAFPLVLRVIDFGPLAFVTFPGELGSMLGVRIKEMFPHKTCIVIGYANDAQGYFVPKDDFGLGYESFVTKLPPGGIEAVLDEFEEWLNQ